MNKDLNDFMEAERIANSVTECVMTPQERINKPLPLTSQLVYWPGPGLWERIADSREVHFIAGIVVGFALGYFIEGWAMLARALDACVLQ